MTGIKTILNVSEASQLPGRKKTHDLYRVKTYPFSTLSSRANRIIQNENLCKPSSFSINLKSS